LTPTKFTSESDNIKFEGFRVQVTNVKKGDTANIRTIPLKYRASGAPNAGFAFEI
jgi:predicted RNA-binding protein with TRAM domain